MSGKQRRDPERERFWREAVAAWERSGLSIRAYCAGRRLSEPSFYSWRRTLRDRAERPVARPRATVRMDRRLAARVDPSDVVQEVLADAAQELSDYLRRRPLPFRKGAPNNETAQESGNALTSGVADRVGPVWRA